MGLWSTRRSIGVLVAALAIGVGACGGSDSSSNGASGGSASKTAEAKPLKIGASLPLTGDFSEPGKAAEQGYKVWQAMINDKGGLLGRKVELVIKDDASNQNTVVSDYNALISGDKVDMLLGTFSSLLNLPASAVAERARMLYVEPAGGNPDIFKRGFKTIFFAQQATAAHQGDVWAKWLTELPADKRPKTAAYPTLDDPFTTPTSEGIEAILKAAGIQTVYRKTYTADTKNFDSIANAVKAKSPDLVVAGTQFEDGVGFLRALGKVGFTPKWLYQTNAPSFGSQYADGVGAENTEGVFYAVSHSQESKTPGNPEFVAAYQAMFPGSDTVPEDAADAYAAAQVLQATVEANKTVAKNDQLKLADWLRSNPVPTVLGNLSWNADGSPKGEFLVGQWQNGKPEIVLPADAATSETIVEGYKPTAK
ncbi:MAG: branched-chain amino acid transport system substrate-binding protein [Solirubrobacteraceae bacterium]|nr:branched-chain amino acid transport system substrate-binding protein [Solirubrobacteraceae bacterium]